MADPNQTKQIVTDVVGDYWKLFPSFWNITLRLRRRAIFQTSGK